MNAAANQYGNIQQTMNQQKQEQLGLSTGLAGSAAAFAGGI
jgi:hypothetical protein